jgi:hypothetical protein
MLCWIFKRNIAKLIPNMVCQNGAGDVAVVLVFFATFYIKAKK